MPIQKNNRTTTWTVNTSNDTWTLAKDAKITINDNGHGIYEAGQDGNLIKVLGDIRVTGMAYGVSINGSSTEVVVGADSRINAKLAVSGIFSEAAGAHILNRGVVEGDVAGIQGAIWSNVENYGTVRGADFGIWHSGEGSQIYNYGTVESSGTGIASLADGTYVENSKGSEISGDIRAIFLEGNGDAKIVNHGILRGGPVAIESEDSVLTVRNTGKIFGDVLLGDGDDIFDSRKGTLNGKVVGGEDDDDYYVGAHTIRIVEAAGGNSGFDEVYSTVSHKLAANVEAVHLLGKKDINATGNSADNYLYGNGGDNALKGGGGTDYLRGLGGDDRLTGGGAQDYFVFNRSGVDHITDFQDGMDLVAIAGVTSQGDFDALNIKQVDGSTVINFGGGDKVIIDGLLKTDFSYSDIATII